jgi:hypothetical protein
LEKSVLEGLCGGFWMKTALFGQKHGQVKDALRLIEKPMRKVA